MPRLSKEQMHAIVVHFREKFIENAACHELLKISEILDAYLTEEQRNRIGITLIDYLAAENYQDAEKLLQSLNFNEKTIDTIIKEIREYQELLQHIVSSL